MHGSCIMKHLAPEGDFTTSEPQAINWCRMSKGIFFIINISNHQDTHLQQSETDKVTNFNMIHGFNWPRKNHVTTEERRTWRKPTITLCSESKKKLRKMIGKWILILDMVPIPRLIQSLLQKIWNMVKIQRTTKLCTKEHWILNRQKVKIAMPLPPSSMQNNPHKPHNHTFIYGSYQNVLPSKAIRTSPGHIKIRRHIWVKTAHRLQEDSTLAQMAGITPYP